MAAASKREPTVRTTWEEHFTLRIDNFTQNAGITNVSVGAALTSSGTIYILGGVLSGGGSVGTGTLPVNVISSGTVSPGGDGSVGVLTIVGNYTQTVTGVLNLDVGGYNPGTDFDQLIVTGSVQLAGTLNVNLLNGFTPNSGDSFQVMIFGSLTGSFSVENSGPFTVTSGSSSLTLVAS